MLSSGRNISLKYSTNHLISFQNIEIAMSTNSIRATYINGKMPVCISDKWLFKVLHVASYVNSEE